MSEVNQQGHIVDTELLLAAEGELPAEDLARVRDHLKHCAGCREMLTELEGFDEFLRDAGGAFRFRRNIARGQRRWRWSAWLPAPRWGIPATVMAVLIALLVFPPQSELSARDCIDRAVSGERAHPRLHRRIRLRTLNGEWMLAHTVATSNDPRLARWQSAFRAAGLDCEDLLSPGAYRRWSESLAAKSQLVKRERGMVRVVTSSESGAVRRAELALDPRDYSVVESIWEVPALGTVRATAEPETLVATSAAAVVAAAVPAAVHGLAVAPDLELVELDVRQRLAQMHADLGEPIDVRRAGGNIRVEGVAESAARRDELGERLREMANVEFAVQSAGDLGVLPANSSGGGSFDSGQAPLAETWLKDNFASSATAQTFAIETLDRVAQVEAVDHALEVLRDRYRHPDDLSAAARALLTSVREQHREELAQAWCALDYQLRALLWPEGAATGCRKRTELSNDERAVLPLIGPLIARGNPGITLEETLQRLRTAFTK